MLGCMAGTREHFKRVRSRANRETNTLGSFSHTMHVVLPPLHLLEAVQVNDIPLTAPADHAGQLEAALTATSESKA
jgi:hypothetical protein